MNKQHRFCFIRLRWAGHVAPKGERRGAYRALVGKPEGRNHLEEEGVDGRILLKWIFDRLDGGTWTGSIWLRTGTRNGLL
jgi:hypothetical protein